MPPWLQPLELRKDAVLGGLAARLAAGSDAEQVAARLLMNDVEGAALIASRSNDPVAYRLALARCGGPASPAEPHCSVLSAQGWAQMDPEDARPWMVEAAEAVMRHDDAAAGRALEQVLQRSKRSPSSPLIATVARAAGQVRDEAGLGLAMVQVIGMDAALPIRELLFSRYCRPEAVREGARRNSCERWARWQFEHADSFMDAMMAVSTADRVGLPAAERPYTREQLDRGMRRLVEDSETMVAYDCRSLRRLGRWAVKRVEQGELKQALEAAGY